MKKRRVLALVLVAVMAVALLAGCGKKKEEEPAEDVVAAATPSPSAIVAETPTPSPKQTKLVGTVVNVTASVNVRGGPSTESEIVGQGELGQVYTVLKEYYTSEWHKIEYEGAAAYIHVDYLDVQEVEVAD